MSLPSKKIILITLLVLWLVFSSGYIGWSIWNNVRNQLMSQAYRQGIVDTIGQLIQQAENPDCAPFPVFNKDENKEVRLINTKCLTNKK